MSILKPRTVSIPIYQGDDAERLAELRMAVAVAERQATQAQGGPRRGGDPSPSEDVKAAQDAYDAFVDEAAERAAEVVVRHIGSRRFRELVAGHPPRMVKDAEGNDVVHDDDTDYDVNIETFPRALLTFAEAGEDGIRTIVSPEFKSRKALEDFLDDELSDGILTQIFVTAYWHNRSGATDPKEFRYSPSTNATSG